ncbi:MAG: RAMP superfamily CRISPR-associated protein [Haliangiales bacterium]
MFRKSYNRAVLHLRVDTVTPLLIQAGDSGLDPAAADITCVRTRHARWGSTVFIPGSSFKGVIRSAAEAAVRGHKFGPVSGACDDPLNHKQNSCSGKLQKSEADSSAIHRQHCLACRTFGSMAMKGRAAPRDLFPWPDDAAGRDPSEVRALVEHANQLELRHGVAIDRLTGSVKHGPFDQELVPAGVSFWGDIALENYQACQLGLLAQAFDSVNDGIAQLGGSKSRGLGAARVQVERIVHEQRTAGADPLGVGQLAADVERDAYGLVPDYALPKAAGTRRGLATRFEVSGDDTEAWLNAGRDALGALAQLGAHS